MTDVFDDLVGVSKDSFDYEACLSPYLVYLKFYRNQMMGNRSIFTVLSEKYQDLPGSTAFTLRLSDDDEETAGVFSLRDFVNGGTDKNTPAFIVDGTEEKVTLLELMEVDGWDMLSTDERYRSWENATKNTNILLKGDGLMKVWKNDADGHVNAEKIWKAFWEKYHDSDAFSNFIELFEFIQIKSYSEAIAETIGSLMVIQHGTGRNPHPVNFSKELYLRFNMPPLHMIQKTLIPKVVAEIVDNEKKAFFSKTPSRLKFSSLSSSIGNFRKDEEDRSHLPVSMFN